MVDACKASASRLGVEQIPLYQIHFPDIIQPFKAFGLEKRKDELVCSPGFELGALLFPDHHSRPGFDLLFVQYWDGLAQCFEQGLAANVGVCNYGPLMVEKVHAYLAERGIPLASNQINFSLMYRKEAEATIAKCNELGVPVISYFPLANGLLAGRYDADNLPPFPKSLTMKKYVMGDGSDAYPEGGYTPLLDALRRIAAKRGKTVPQVSINWVLCKGAIPIPGARDGAMAEANMGAMGWRLTPEEVKELEQASDAVGFEFSSGGFKLE